MVPCRTESRGVEIRRGMAGSGIVEAKCESDQDAVALLDSLEALPAALSCGAGKGGRPGGSDFYCWE
jgi:hypothetical protein